MSGMLVFQNNGVVRFGSDSSNYLDQEQAGGSGRAAATGSRRKALVYLPTEQVVSSYRYLEQILVSCLGWERYYGGDSDLIQFHRSSSIDLISLPRDFSRFNSIYMYDIVVKNPNFFHVRDL
ncbi:flowering-promoting factor 1-like protein 2 [Impatiens glandulifera]|uniref:flowering-promoting factor 1-like protein 2 n=1 Tax=Impatiens glandulifera TaxID=253017 RepID=UPI001FB09701|nr:flowering-promoting factor 1-like protein 2 [Impatiens glandulifera]